MLHRFCLDIVKASAVVVCIGVGASACVERERVVVHDERRGGGEHREHHDEHHDERHEERH